MGSMRIVDYSREGGMRFFNH